MGSCRVCVTGGAGYIGSALVHSLLQNGYTVHATLRNLGDETKVKFLESFPYAKERLHLFEADIYKPEEFEKAIQGCVYVFHVATPLQHTAGYTYGVNYEDIAFAVQKKIKNYHIIVVHLQFNNTAEAAVTGVKKITNACIHSRTVKRLIYTASVVAASPLTEDDNGYGYKNTMDESCWTPSFHPNILYANDLLKDYTSSKTESEKELLRIGEEKANELEVVTLACGLVGGGGFMSYPANSVLLLISQIVNIDTSYQCLRYLEELLGKVPIVHIDDVCRAHIFCAETPSVSGRFLCASDYVTSAAIAKYYQETYPQLNQEYREEHAREIKWGSKKLEEKGFAYKYNTKMILDDCIESAKGSGLISN